MAEAAGPTLEARPGLQAARVCLDILRGASQLAPRYAHDLTEFLRTEAGDELVWVEALATCLTEVVRAATQQGDRSPSAASTLISEATVSTVVSERVATMQMLACITTKAVPHGVGPDCVAGPSRDRAS
jgi:hypothetical protein